MFMPEFLFSVVLLMFVAAHVNGFSLPKSVNTLPLSTYTISEVLIDSQSTQQSDDKQSTSFGTRIKNGESVIQVKDLVTPAECQYIIEQVLRHDAVTSPSAEKHGLVRLPTQAAARRASTANVICADPLSEDVDKLLHEILIRTATVIRERIPSISHVLFNEEDLCELFDMDRLKFSSREPAINIYTPGGKFLAHTDSQSLTVLIPLSCPEQFQGGGTSFWSQDSRGHRVEGPTIVLKPDAGTAMLFGGCVTHAGVAVKEGTRVVFVASFSRVAER